MIPAPALEIAVLLWGLILLLAESFAGKTDRRGFAIAGIAGLFAVLVASFFLAPPPAAASPVSGVSTQLIRSPSSSSASLS